MNILYHLLTQTPIISPSFAAIILSNQLTVSDIVSRCTVAKECPIPGYQVAQGTNFLWWFLMCLIGGGGSCYGTCFISPFRAYNFAMVPGFLGHVCSLVVICGGLCTLWTSDVFVTIIKYYL